jgi:uncharacterized membrane protein YphA (DoxX/SURF4 family)
MRLPLLAVAALAVLRIVCGLHFFLEGVSHLRDADWSSAGFRKAAVGPLADFYRSSLPETGDWAATLGSADDRPADEASKAWQASVVASWQRLLETRSKAVSLSGEAKAVAEQSLKTAGGNLADYCKGIADDLADYRLQVRRLAAMEQKPGSRDIPFERERLAKKQKELAGQASAWMKDAAAIGQKLVAEWDGQLPDATARSRADAATGPSELWKADRFVSWSLVTIGACLVVGLLTKFNAVGGALFLASVIASQPFWVPGAQATYNQWVELAALLAIAALPIGGWSGLDFFFKRWFPQGCCGSANSCNR